MNDAMIRVMLVDDQELIRTGFRLVLMAEDGIEVVAEAADGESALAELERMAAVGTSCDVVLMDVRMPGMNGIDATAAVVDRYPESRVLVLTTFDLDEYAIGAVRAGASGFLLKDARPVDLVEAIRRIAAGDAAMSPTVTRRLIEHLREAPGPSREAGGAAAGSGSSPNGEVLASLTERELDVLRLISQGRNNAEIGAELFLSESTVKTHVGRVLSKLRLRDRVHAVIFAKEHGV